MGRLNFKKLGLLIIFLGLFWLWASGGWGQTLEGFPKIIFNDPYRYQKVLEWFRWVNPGEVNFENYWGQIDSCGINLDVTWGDEISLNNPFGVKIFNDNLSQVIDTTFPWTDTYMPRPHGFGISPMDRTRHTRWVALRMRGLRIRRLEKNIKNHFLLVFMSTGPWSLRTLLALCWRGPLTGIIRAGIGPIMSPSE